MDTHNPHLSPIGFLQNLGVLARMRIGGERVIPNPVLEDVFSDQEIEKLKKMKDTDDYTEKIRIKIGQSRLRNVIILKKILELNKEIYKIHNSSDFPISIFSCWRVDDFNKLEY